MCGDAVEPLAKRNRTVEGNALDAEPGGRRNPGGDWKTPWM